MKEIVTYVSHYSTYFPYSSEFPHFHSASSFSGLYIALRVPDAGFFSLVDIRTRADVHIPN